MPLISPLMPVPQINTVTVKYYSQYTFLDNLNLLSLFFDLTSPGYPMVSEENLWGLLSTDI